MRSVSEQAVFRNSPLLPDLVEYLHVRCPCYLEPKKKRRKKKKRDAEGKFVDDETMTNYTLTKVIGQFEQMVIAVEQWRQTFAEGTSERALFDDELKIHCEKLS